MKQHASREARAAGLDGFVCCRIGEEQYAMRGTHVRNVARADRIAREGEGGARVGTLHEGNAAIPVYSLAALFGMSLPPAVDGHVVVTGGEHAPFGLLVARIMRASASVNDEVLPLPPFAGPQASSWFDGLLMLEDTACLVLAPDGLDPRATSGLGPRAARPRRRGPAQHIGSSDIVVTFSSPALPHPGTRRYALAGPRVAGLVQSLPCIALPGRSPHVKELAWWQNSAVPVLEFTNGHPPGAAQSATRYLVARCGPRAGAALVAFRVDADVSLHRATAEDAQVSGRDGLPFLRGVFNVSGERVGLLDLDALAGGVVGASEAAAVGDPVLI